jgi:hypothetical protein
MKMLISEKPDSFLVQISRNVTVEFESRKGEDLGRTLVGSQCADHVNWTEENVTARLSTRVRKTLFTALDSLVSETGIAI